MKCQFYQGDKGPCWPEECEGEAWFVIAVLDEGEPMEGSSAVLCHAHIAAYAELFLKRMQLSLQVENDLWDIGALDDL